MSDVLARLRFQKLTSPVSGSEEWGEVELLQGGKVQLHAGPGLRSRILRTAERVDHAALLYGATAFMGFAAAGTTLVLKRKNVWGYILLIFAALTGIGASGVRVAAKQAPRIFDKLFDQDDVTARLGDDGALTLTLTNRPGRGMTFRFESGEFHSGDATRFITALGKK